MDDIVERVRAMRDENELLRAVRDRRMQDMQNMQVEIERLRADKAAISDTASGYLHEIEALRSALPVLDWDY
jgi:hypothetical protein